MLGFEITEDASTLRLKLLAKRANINVDYFRETIKYAGKVARLTFVMIMSTFLFWILPLHRQQPPPQSELLSNKNFVFISVVIFVIK